MQTHCQQALPGHWRKRMAGRRTWFQQSASPVSFSWLLATGWDSVIQSLRSSTSDAGVKGTYWMPWILAGFLPNLGRGQGELRASRRIKLKIADGGA